MKTFIKTVLVLLILISVLFVGIAFSLLDSSPSTQQTTQLDTQTARDSKILAKRLYRLLKHQSELTFISINQDETDGLIALLHRAVPQVSADMALSTEGANIAASIKLPLFTPISYLNIQAKLLPSKTGIKFESITAGSVTFDDNQLVNGLIMLMDFYLKGQVASKAFNMVKTVKFAPERVFISAHLDSALVSPNNKQSIFTQIRDELALFGDVENIAFYYQSIVAFARTRESSGPESLSHYVNNIFQLAHKRTMAFEGDNEHTASHENQSALLALALYFGSNKFKLLVGEFEPLSLKDEQHRYLKRTTTTLQQRLDLQQHFIYSIALQLFSSQYASDALGEFKEFLDSNKGGSGFSFADLQADRAGTRLAMIVTSSEESARHAQVILSTIEDHELLPSIKGLDEGLNETEFKNEYESIDSTNYKETLNKIDNRLKELPFYNIGW